MMKKKTILINYVMTTSSIMSVICIIQIIWNTRITNSFVGHYGNIQLSDLTITSPF